MTPDEAHRRIAAVLAPDFIGRFYSPGETVGLGKGKIFDSVPCPLFDPNQGVFITAEALVYVLTHECDVDAENERVFNEEVLVCPILRLEFLVEEYEQLLPGEQLAAFLGNLGARNIPRLVYLPAIPETLNYGGVLYLNQITHAHVSAFTSGGRAAAICAVTAFGLQHVEFALEQHLLRPKAERLAFDESWVEAR